MPTPERKLPDLVSRLRIDYEGKATIDKAKADAKGLQTELDKVSKQSAQTAAASVSQAQQHVSILDQIRARKAAEDDPFGPPSGSELRQLKRRAAAAEQEAIPALEGEFASSGTGRAVALEPLLRLLAPRIGRGGGGGRGTVRGAAGLIESLTGEELSAGGLAAVTGGLAAVGAAAAAVGISIRLAQGALASFKAEGDKGLLKGDQLAAYRGLTAAQTELSTTVHGLAVHFGNDLAPAATVAIHALDGLLRQADEIVQGFGSIFDAVEHAVGAMERVPVVGGVVSALGQVKDTIFGIGGASERAKQTQAELEAEQKREIAVLKDQKTALDALHKAEDDTAKAKLDHVSATIAAEDADTRLGTARKTLVEAEAKLSELQKTGGRSSDEAIAATDKLRNAREALAAANRRLARTTEDIADKEVAVRDAELEQGVQSDEAIKARRDLARARDDQAQATTQVADRTSDLAKAQKAFDDAPAKALKDATDALTAAQKEDRDAAAAAANAHADLDGVMAALDGHTLSLADHLRLVNEELGKLGGPESSDLLARIGTSSNLGAATIPDFGSAAAAAAAPVRRAPTTSTQLAETTAQVNKVNNISVTVPTTQQLADEIDRQIQWFDRS